jgi:hypothetical protein
MRSGGESVLGLGEGARTPNEETILLTESFQFTAFLDGESGQKRGHFCA